MTLLGYTLGQRMPWIEHYITPLILLIVVLSVTLAIFHILKEKDSRELLLAKLKLLLRNLTLNKKVD